MSQNKSKTRNHKFYWLSPKVEPRDTKKYGDGLFASKKIKKDELILVVGGYIMTVQEESEQIGKYNDNGVQINNDLVISVSDDSEYAGFNYLNHTCNPNAGFGGQIFLVAMRDIEKNEEITIDYAMVLHRAKDGPRYELKCLCGNKNCRKIITDNDWKKNDLQKKYKGYFQYFIQKKIDKG